MRDCAQYEIQLTAYAAAEMTGPDHRGLKNHLSRCADCRAELAREVELRTVLAGLPPARCPESVSHYLQDTLDLNGQPSSARANWWPAGLGLVAATLLAVLLVPGLLNGPLTPAQVAAPEFTAAEIAQARHDVVATLTLAADVMNRSRNKTVVEVFGAHLPRAISGSLRPQGSDAHILNNPTDEPPTGGNG